MIKANKILLENKITGINVITKIPMFISLGSENFQINNGTEELEYLLINISDTEYELQLNENIENTNLVLIYSLKDYDGNKHNGSVLLDSKPTEELIPDSKNQLTNIKFINDKLIFEILKNENEDPFNIINSYQIIIKKFKINYFSDFFESETIFKEFKMIPKTIKFYCDYVFESNYIYEITIMNINTFDEFKINYIHNKPNVYFSSRYHLNNALRELDIELELKENFDTKLLIWNESLKLLALMEITFESLPRLTEDVIALFSEYISNKIILNKLISVFSAQFLPGTDYNESNTVKGKRLGDFQITQGGESGDSSKIKMVSDKLNSLEKQLKEAIKFLGTGKAKSYSEYILNRSKVLRRNPFSKR